LEAAIRALAEEVGQEIHAEWSVDVPESRHPWTVEELTYRVVREALTNIRKHSDAHTFSVNIVEGGGHLSGTIQDDGRGLPATVRTRMGLPNHLGVDGMRERARLAGGDVTITSSPGKGVRVHFAFPISERV
jgi:signal transduction histidine kinase